MGAITSAAKANVRNDEIVSQIEIKVQELAQVASMTHPFRSLTQLERLFKDFELLADMRISAAAIAALYEKLPAMTAATINCEYEWRRSADFVPDKLYKLEFGALQYDGALPSGVTPEDLAECLTAFFNGDEDCENDDALHLHMAHLMPLYMGVLGEGQGSLFCSLDAGSFTEEMVSLSLETTREVIRASEGDVDKLAQALFPNAWNKVAPQLGLPLVASDAKESTSSRPRG